MLRTKGLSNKLLAPITASLSAVGSTFILTGTLDKAAAAALFVAFVGVAAAWFAPADKTEYESTTPDSSSL